jgi:hypothetical protein
MRRVLMSKSNLEILDPEMYKAFKKMRMKPGKADVFEVPVKNIIRKGKKTDPEEPEPCSITGTSE